MSELVTLHWSRCPGTFLNKETGQELHLSSGITSAPAFQGTVREWYETFIEIIFDAINRCVECPRCEQVKIVCDHAMLPILQASISYRPVMAHDNQKCPVRVGRLKDCVDIFVDHRMTADVLNVVSMTQEKVLGFVIVHDSL